MEGWFDFHDIYDYAIKTAPEGSYLYEIGVYQGLSFSYLAWKAIDSGKRLNLVGIDTFEKTDEYPDAVSIEDTFANIEAYLARKGIRDYRNTHFFLTKIKSQDIATDFNHRNNHFVFIDGAHDYESVKKDIALALNMKAALIGLHDYTNPKTEVKKAVEDSLISPRRIVGKVIRNCYLAHTEVILRQISEWGDTI